MKRQKNIRLSEASLEKLADLSQRYGTETTAIEIAIDRLHREEQIMEYKITFHGRDQDIQVGTEGIAWYDPRYGSWIFKPHGSDSPVFCDKDDLEF